ncbi:TRAP-type C4-dicarboxylate transport system substrate-binding protein [Caballeronia udeis]|uniref:TRAP-type C4-dicarboxylate transport system substrate-binding protein n=1 Tax=Caballeronia udeis TaxID=1232866 RepID=A0ABW8MQU7_9BURK
MTATARATVDIFRFRRMKLQVHKLAALFGASFALSASVAWGQTTLRLADSLPAGHVIAQLVTKPFMDQVQKESGGRISFQYFPGEQLGKARDLLMLTQSGVADVGYISPDYASDKMPLTAGFELPGIFLDYCQGTKALWAATHDGGYLQKKEFEPNQIVPIVMLMLPAYQILLENGRPVAGLKDLSGLKIRSAGGAMDFTLQRLGMVPVKMTPPEVYESMSRGTIDGAVFPYMSAMSYGMQPLVKQGSTSHNFGTVVLTYSIGFNKWRQLSLADQGVIMKVGRSISLGSCTRFSTVEKESADAFRAKGMKVIPLSPVDDSQLKTTFEKVSGDWAKSLDQRGKPGDETLSAVKQAIIDAQK